MFLDVELGLARFRIVAISEASSGSRARGAVHAGDWHASVPAFTGVTVTNYLATELKYDVLRRLSALFDVFCPMLGD